MQLVPLQKNVVGEVARANTERFRHLLCLSKSLPIKYSRINAWEADLSSLALPGGAQLHIVVASRRSTLIKRRLQRPFFRYSQADLPTLMMI